MIRACLRLTLNCTRLEPEHVTWNMSSSLWLGPLRFPAVHRPLLAYVNTALVAPALGHQAGVFHQLGIRQTFSVPFCL